jgi:hypothetical protein
MITIPRVVFYDISKERPKRLFYSKYGMRPANITFLYSFAHLINHMDDESTNSNGKGNNNSNPQEKYGTDGDISKDYDTILKESAVLTTVSGFLFAFLLNISINRPSDFSFEDGIILMIALFTITFATSFLSMPVFYHHLQYPYRNIDKFKFRSHRFIVFGTAPLFITLYLGLLLGLKFGLHLAFDSPVIEYWAYILSLVPFASVYIFYRFRK